MVLINSIKKSFNCVIDNVSMIVLLVMYLLGAKILTAFIVSAKIKLIAQILILCLFAFIFVFFSGWFEVIKESTDSEKIKEKNFYPIFLEGIGKNIIPVTIGIITYGVFILLTILLAQFVALKLFGDVSFLANDINKIASENGNFLEYFSNLSVNQKYIIYCWSFCIMISILIFNFVSLFYFPAILYSEEKIYLRPLISIWTNLKFLFKNFFGALGLGVFVCFVNIILGIIQGLSGQNIVLSFISQFVHICFIVYVIMLIFNYYEAKNNSDNGADSIGENETIDIVSKEN